jgi:hypothetical protein
MLKNIVAIVLLLNAALAGAIWAVNTGRWVWPDAWRGEVREPERLTRQINPDAIVIKGVIKEVIKSEKPAESKLEVKAATVTLASATTQTTAPVTAASAPAVTTTLCLLSAGNEAAQSAKLSTAIKDALPNAKLQTTVSREGGFWMVYMGKYVDAPTTNKKFAELEKLKIPGDYGILRDTPAYQPGISLGAFRERENANLRLTEVVKKGVKSARVVERVPARQITSFRFPELEATLRSQVEEVVQKAGGKPLELCPNA